MAEKMLKMSALLRLRTSTTNNSKSEDDRGPPRITVRVVAHNVDISIGVCHNDPGNVTGDETWFMDITLKLKLNRPIEGILRRQERKKLDKHCRM